MLVHLIRTKGVSDELYFGCYEFLNHFVGPYNFELSDKPREITIKDEIRIVKPEDPKQKVAIYSERNLHMDNLKPITVGYNIVSKEASEKWLTHRLVRTASPEEVASYYGK